MKKEFLIVPAVLIALAMISACEFIKNINGASASQSQGTPSPSPSATACGLTLTSLNTTGPDTVNHTAPGNTVTLAASAKASAISGTVDSECLAGLTFNWSVDPSTPFCQITGAADGQTVDVSGIAVGQCRVNDSLAADNLSAPAFLLSVQ